MNDLNSLSLPDLFAELMRDGVTRGLFRLAREEDLGSAGRDITSEMVIADDAVGAGQFVCRGKGVIAGVAALPLVGEEFAPDCVITPALEDGMVAQQGAVIAQIDGPLRQILALERTALNVLSRLSGIATLTAEYVRLATESAPSGCPKICDTRKTTPGLRALEKYAVRCGGGWLHRQGLYDAMLIKDNHLQHMGASIDLNQLERAIERARAGSELRFVELEVDTLDQLDRAVQLRAGLVDILLLDNMSPDEIVRAIAVRDKRAPRVQLEASGGVTLETVGAIAATGVDRISVGALTHSASALDIGLDLH